MNDSESGPNQGEIDVFLLARSKSQVLREVLLPEGQLASFVESHSQEQDIASRCSVPFLAYKNNELDAFCAPLHDLIFARRGGAASLTHQYRTSLVEKWYAGPYPHSRFNRFRRYVGQLMEFHVACFMETAFGWQVHQMEAFSREPCPDIVLQSDEVGTRIAASVKTLCRDEDIFDLSLSPAPVRRRRSVFMSPYAPLNYLLFRICEAAWGLSNQSSYKRLVVINLMEMLRFHGRLGEDWLDFDNLRFIYPDEGLEDFWATRAEKRERAAETLAHMSDHIEGILICHVSPGFIIKPIRIHWYR
jgi:hypothetical protein